MRHFVLWVFGVLFFDTLNILLVGQNAVFVSIFVFNVSD